MEHKIISGEMMAGNALWPLQMSVLVFLGQPFVWIKAASRG